MFRKQILLIMAFTLSPLDLCGDPTVPPEKINPYLDPTASLVGDIKLGNQTFIGPMSSLRAHPGSFVMIGDESSVQDGAVVVGISNFHSFDSLGKPHGVKIGSRTTIGAQAQVHAPARVGDNVFIGMRALVFDSEVGNGCVIQPGAIVMGVRLPASRSVPANLVVIDQDAAEALPKVTSSDPFRRLHERMIAIYSEMEK